MSLNNLSSEEYEQQSFITTMNKKKNSDIELQPSQTQSSLRNCQHKRQLPHYWPADTVPYIGISYCQLMQYIFAVLFISVLLWIFWGLKHFEQSSSKANGPVKASDNSELATKSESGLRLKQPLIITEEEFQKQFEEKFMQQHAEKVQTENNNEQVYQSGENAFMKQSQQNNMVKSVFDDEQIEQRLQDLLRPQKQARDIELPLFPNF